MWATHSLVFSRSLFDISVVQIFKTVFSVWNMSLDTHGVWRGAHVPATLLLWYLTILTLSVQHKPCSVLQMTRQETQMPPVLWSLLTCSCITYSKYLHGCTNAKNKVYFLQADVSERIIPLNRRLSVLVSYWHPVEQQVQPLAVR